MYGCVGSKSNVPINNKEAGKLDIMSRISSIAGGSLMTYIGVGAVIAGVSALTIATGGLALPAIAAALTGGMGATAFVASAVAVGTIASGAGLAVMGVNEVGYGATGKNLLLDTVFKGNTNLYSNTQLVLTMGTVAGSQYSSAYSYKETVFRNELAGTSKTQAPQKVIGHYPEYVEMSNELGTKPFSIPDNIWNKMTPAEQWAANQKFLDRAIAKGSEFNLATPIDKVRPESYLEKEINYLTSQGYKLNSAGTKLVK